MKKILLYSAITIFAFSILTMVSCKKDKENEPATVNVTLTALDGETVDVSGLSVEFHTNATYTALYKKANSVGSASTATASLTEMAEGTYFLVAWKDNDGDNTFSKGDYFGFYPQAIKIENGNDPSFTVEIYEVK